MLTHRALKLCILPACILSIYLFCTLIDGVPTKNHPLDGTWADNNQVNNPASTSKQQEGIMHKEDPETDIKSPIPVIGVLTQVLRDYKRFTDKHSLHIASSYVKWIESAGAQVMPILLNEDDDYYERVFRQTNGLLFPGGDNLLDPNRATPMMEAAKKLYKLAVEANDRGDFYPIWGTCLGHELLTVLSSGKNELDSCQSLDMTSRVEFVEPEERGKLFKVNRNANLPALNDLDYPKMIMNTLKSSNVTYNYHRKCVTEATLKRANLLDFYTPLAYSYDINNLKYISIFEAKKYPFFGVQFHPEKPAFEFTSGHGHLNVPHGREAIEVSRYFADFFVRQAQLSDHYTDFSHADTQMELIYAHAPLYTAPYDDLYEQRYLFPFSDANNWKNELEILRDTPQGVGMRPTGRGEYWLPPGVSPLKNEQLLVEFLDHVPADGEQISEEVGDAFDAQFTTTTTTEKPPPVEIEMELFPMSRRNDDELEDEPDNIVLPKESWQVSFVI